MNVLILGSGGREHAFAWKLAQSKQLENLYIAPGNAGTAQCGTNVNIPATDFEAIKNLVWEKSIDMVLDCCMFVYNYHCFCCCVNEQWKKRL